MAKVVSIEVGYSNIRICEIDYKAKTPRVYRFVMVPTPPGVIEDGYLKESAGLRTAIKEALFRNRIKTKKVIFTVASSKIINREVTLPPVKPNMIEAMIKANMGDYFPIDLSDHEVSHVVLETFKDGDNAGKTRVMLVAVEKVLVASYEALAQSCGLVLVDIDFVGNSIYQAVRKETSKVPSMVLKIEENQTIITIVKDNNMMLQRSINYGIEEAVHEVAASPVFEVVDDKEAWQLIKRRCCLKVVMDNDTNALEPDSDQDDDMETTQARINVTRTLLPLINGVSRVVDFYNSRNPEHIEQAYIIGMGGDMSGLSKLLTNELGIKTNVFQKLEGIVWHPSMGEGDLFNYVASIGASMAPVSVISSEKKQKLKQETNSNSLAVLLGIFFVVASAALAANGYLTYQSALEEQKRLQGLESTYLPAEQIYHNYLAMENFYQEVLTGDLMTDRPNDSILAFLEELEQNLPTDVEVTEFSSDDEKAIMTMNVDDKETAAGVILKLREFESLMQVSVNSLTETTAEEAIEGTDATIEHRYTTFTITCYYYPNVFATDSQQ